MPQTIQEVFNSLIKALNDLETEYKKKTKEGIREVSRKDYIKQYIGIVKRAMSYLLTLQLHGVTLNPSETREIENFYDKIKKSPLSPLKNTDINGVFSIYDTNVSKIFLLQAQACGACFDKKLDSANEQNTLHDLYVLTTDSDIRRILTKEVLCALEVHSFSVPPDLQQQINANTLTVNGLKESLQSISLDDQQQKTLDVLKKITKPQFMLTIENYQQFSRDIPHIPLRSLEQAVATYDHEKGRRRKWFDKTFFLKCFRTDDPPQIQALKQLIAEIRKRPQQPQYVSYNEFKLFMKNNNVKIHTPEQQQSARDKAFESIFEDPKIIHKLVEKAPEPFRIPFRGLS